MSDTNMTNPWLTLGLCPSMKMLEISGLITEMIDTNTRILRKHFHPDKRLGNAENFMAIQAARDALSDSLVRHTRARELDDSLRQGALLQAELNSHRHQAARAIIELKAARLAVDRIESERDEAVSRAESLRKKLRAVNEELDVTRREIERVRADAKATMNRQKRELARQIRDVEEEKARVIAQFDTLHDAVVESGEAVRRFEADMDALKRGNDAIELNLRATRRSLAKEADQKTPVRIAVIGVFASILAVFTVMVFSESAMLGMLLTVMWIGLTILNVGEAFRMVRRLNVASWESFINRQPNAASFNESSGGTEIGSLQPDAMFPPPDTGPDMD